MRLHTPPALIGTSGKGWVSAAFAALARLLSAGDGEPPSTRSSRPRTSRRSASASSTSLPRPSSRPAFSRQTSQNNARDRPRSRLTRPRARLREHLRHRARNDAPATSASTTGNRTAPESARPSSSRRRSGATLSGNVWATERGPREAPRGRDHDRLRPGARNPLLGAGRHARQARVRRPHLRRPRPEPLGRLR